MTNFRIETFRFTGDDLAAWQRRDQRHSNWPVVYALDDQRSIYVGETLNAYQRLRQHLKVVEKRSLDSAQVIVDDEFNKSACLDLESFLIRLLAGDGKFRVLNGNDGITDRDYFQRVKYQQTFNQIFDDLRHRGFFTRSIPEIENSDLFKLSPYKQLTDEQASAVSDILEGLFTDIADGVPSQAVIDGEPGTGKTVIGIYLMKLLSDIQRWQPSDPRDSDTHFAEFFTPGHPDLLQDFRMALVIPQQSLRKSVQRVFSKTPGLSASMAITAFDVGASDEHFDLLIVDETHRLNQRANQPAASANTRFRDITTALFGEDDLAKTQIDWITAKSTHQVFLTDANQSVRTADVPRKVIADLNLAADRAGRRYKLASQMRVAAGDDYIRYVREVLSPLPPKPRAFVGYDLRFFDDFASMQRLITQREREHGLSRLLAGYAWRWQTKGGKPGHDIEIAGIKLPWNRTEVDWVNSKTSAQEVGSIHTVQGYDLNYAGVIIGNDLRYDPVERKLYFDRSNYYDAAAIQNNRKRGINYSPDDLLRYIVNIYGVLLTRGMRGTYVYVCDPHLRDHLRPYFDVS